MFSLVLHCNVKLQQHQGGILIYISLYILLCRVYFRSCAGSWQGGKGEWCQVVVGVAVQRETLMRGTDKTLVCCTPAGPAHPSRCIAGMLIGPCQCFARMRGGREGGEEVIDMTSIAICRFAADERQAAGGLSAWVKTTCGILIRLKILAQKNTFIIGFEKQDVL